MAILNIPDQKQSYTEPAKISEFLHKQGIHYEHRSVPQSFSESAKQEEVLAAFEPFLGEYMANGGYLSCDVVFISKSTPDLESIRAKFLREHTHSEDEIRLFVEGSGLFWFHISDTVFSVFCQPGDLICVPANVKHWFDLGPTPFVRAIRILTNKAGWVPNYTDSKIEDKYNRTEITQ